MSAECFTLPQYVLKSYREAGRSLLPGSEADMFVNRLPPASASTEVELSELSECEACLTNRIRPRLCALVVYGN